MRTRIWIPEKQEIDVSEPPTINIPINLSIGMEGHYHVLLTNTKTQEVKFSGSFKNVLTTRFMNVLGEGGGIIINLFSSLGVGSGSTIPSASDTNLANGYAVRSTNNGSIGDSYTFRSGSAPSGCYWEMRKTRLFTEGQNTGSITEFGWFNGSSELMSRALIRDPTTGAPTTIVKGADDELLVTYEFRAIVPTTTGSYNAVFGPTSHSVTVLPIRIATAFILGTNRGNGWGSVLDTFGGNWGLHFRVYSSAATNSCNPIGGGSFNTWPSPGTGQPTVGGFNSGPDVGVAFPYTASNFYRDASYIIRATNSSINPGGQIQGLTAAPWSAFDTNGEPPWMMYFDPPIPKPDTHQVKFTIRHSWYQSGTI
jgi:hypothetical protein